MEFGIWSNSFRRHDRSAEAAYEEDLYEIILADQLGFRDAWISEHLAEPLYVGAVDILSLPELLMCKAAALTRQIRFGAAVKIIHLTHPVDIATQAAVAENVIGAGRYIFGFGVGFPNSIFSEARGLTYEDRHARTKESLDLILRCWESEEPFDWRGEHWSGSNIVVLPKPASAPHMPIAVATATPETLEMAGSRGYLVLAGSSPAGIRKVGDVYAPAALQAGHENPLENITVPVNIYVADSQREGIEDIRAGVEHEMTFQRARGLLSFMARDLGLDVDQVTFDQLVETEHFIIGDPDYVARTLERLFEESGGFGTLLYRCGKSWASREKIEISMRRFAAEVVPRLEDLRADRV